MILLDSYTIDLIYPYLENFLQFLIDIDFYLTMVRKERAILKGRIYYILIISGLILLVLLSLLNLISI